MMQLSLGHFKGWHSLNVLKNEFLCEVMYLKLFVHSVNESV